MIFLDPPFSDDLYDELCRLLATEGWLATDARVYIEMDGNQPEVRMPENWRVLKNKNSWKSPLFNGGS